jgi:hypothetical protein
MNPDEVDEQLMRLGQTADLRPVRDALLVWLEQRREEAERITSAPRTALQPGVLAHAAGALHQVRALREELLAIFERVPSEKRARRRKRPAAEPEE